MASEVVGGFVGAVTVVFNEEGRHDGEAGEGAFLFLRREVGLQNACLLSITCVTLFVDMFEDYDRGEKVQKAGMFRARLLIFGALILASLIAVGVMKWSKHSLHQKLTQHHEETMATFINVFPNGKPPNVIYVITYTFNINGKSYQNTSESSINPTAQRGVVWFDPDDPDKNELQPITQ